MTDTTNEPGLITIAKAAVLLECTERWVRELCNRGYIPKPARGMVPLVGAVRGCVRALKDDERRHSKSAEARRVQEARAKEIELRIARESGDLIPTVAAEETFAEVLGVFRQRLAGVPAAATRDLTIRDAIDREIETAISDCRDQFRRRKEELLAGIKKGRKA